LTNDEKVIAIMAITNDGIPAIATLIAAVPDMLAALKASIADRDLPGDRRSALYVRYHHADRCGRDRPAHAGCQRGMGASASKAGCMPIPAASNSLAAALMSFLS
jgi:hypothetical protein